MYVHTHARANVYVHMSRYLCVCEFPTVSASMAL